MNVRINSGRIKQGEFTKTIYTWIKDGLYLLLCLAFIDFALIELLFCLIVVLSSTKSLIYVIFRNE
jgi:hypothetical protein